MKNKLRPAKSFVWIFAIAVLFTTSSQAKKRYDCCGSGDEVYTPSKQRIKIIHSPELNIQLAALKDKPAELSRMRKAIDAANKLIQGHVNHNLYQYGWEDSPANSVLKEAGWKRNFGPVVSVSLKEFRAFVNERDRSEGFNGNQYITSARYLHLLCPYSQLDPIQTSGENLYLTYRFLHIARPNSKVFHMLDRSALDISKNGKIQTKTIALNAELKLLPYDKADINWWNTTGDTIEIYKRDLRGREQTNLSLTEPYKPNLRKLLNQVEEAQKVCDKPRLI